MDMAKQNIEELKLLIKNESYRLEELKAQRDSVSREFDNKDEIRTALQAELQSDSDYQAIEKQEICSGSLRVLKMWRLGLNLWIVR